MTQLKLLVDIRTVSNGGQLLAKAGDIVTFLSDEGGYFIAETLDGSKSFPLESDEYERIDTGEHGMQESASDPETVIHFNRGKSTRASNAEEEK